MKNLYLLITIILFQTFYAQTTRPLNTSGTVKTEQNQGVPAKISIAQYINGNYENKGTFETDADGKFDATLNNITDVKNDQNIKNQESEHFIKVLGNQITNPQATKVKIKYYSILGEELKNLEQELNINAGQNKIKDPNPTEIHTNRLIRRIIFPEQDNQEMRQILINLGNEFAYSKKEKKITQKIQKTTQHTKLQKTTDNKTFSPDSTYLKYIITPNDTAKFLKDTLNFTVPEGYETINLTNLEIILKEKTTQRYIKGIFTGTVTGQEGNGIRTELIYLINGKTTKDTTETNGTYQTTIDSILTTKDQTTQDIKLTFNPLTQEYKPTTKNKTIQIENEQITATINAELEKKQNTKIPMSVRNFLHQNKEGIEIYLENNLGEKLVFTSDANGKVLLDIPEDFGDNVKMYFKDKNQPDSMYVNFQAIQDSINFGRKNLFNAETKDTVTAQGYPDKKILNYINAKISILKQKVDEKDPLVYKILERYSDASHLGGFDGVFDMTNKNHVGMLLNTKFIRKMDANIVDTLYIITSNKVQHDQHGTTEDIPQRDIDVRDEWLNDWQYLNNNPLDGWKNMYMKIVYVDDITDNPVIDNLRENYNLSNFIQVYFADDQGLGNVAFFTNDNVFQRGKVYNVSGGTSIWGMGSELAGEMVLQEEKNSSYTFNNATAAKDVSKAGKPYRGTRMTNTGDKLRKLMDNIDQGYKFPWKKYFSRN